ncbi:MAG: hypothetical protein ACC651_10605 [Candidatus Scalindua sp.]
MGKSKKSKKKPPEKIIFHYKKTPSFRSYHADGIYGGLTPRGKVYCEFFIDHNPTPQTATHELSESGYISGKPTEKIVKEGVIRQIECGIIFDIETAITFKEWLNDKINQYDKTIKPLKKGKK